MGVVGALATMFFRVCVLALSFLANFKALLHDIVEKLQILEEK